MRGDIRSALSSISRNAQVSGVIGVELIAIAVFVGWYSSSILLGASVLVGLALVWRFQIVVVLMAFFLTGVWGYLGWSLGLIWFTGIEWGIVLGAAGLLIGYAIHLQGLGFIRGRT